MAYTKMRIYAVMVGVNVESVHKSQADAEARALRLRWVLSGADTVDVLTANATLEFVKGV